MSELARLQPENTVLLVIDLQEKLLPAIHEGQGVIDASRKLIESAKVLGVPMLLTEQYPAGLGPTCAAISQSMGDPPAISKMKFSACVDAIAHRLREIDRPDVLVAGVETHVCVQQTVLDLLRLGHRAYVCSDAVGSRRLFDRDIALERMRQAGAIVTTTESAIFEMLEEAGTELFKRVLKVIK